MDYLFSRRKYKVKRSHTVLQFRADKDKYGACTQQEKAEARRVM